MPPLLYFTAFYNRQVIFSVSQCLSLMISMHIDFCQDPTTISLGFFACLSVIEVKTMDIMRRKGGNDTVITIGDDEKY